jgi:hypothetical protein
MRLEITAGSVSIDASKTGMVSVVKSLEDGEPTEIIWMSVDGTYSTQAARQFSADVAEAARLAEALDRFKADDWLNLAIKKESRDEIGFRLNFGKLIIIVPPEFYIDAPGIEIK